MIGPRSRPAPVTDSQARSPPCVSAASSKGTVPTGARGAQPSPKDHVFLQWPVAEHLPQRSHALCGAWRPVKGQEELCPSRAVPEGSGGWGLGECGSRKLGLSNGMSSHGTDRLDLSGAEQCRDKAPGREGLHQGDPSGREGSMALRALGNSQGPVSQCGPEEGQRGRPQGQAGLQVLGVARVCWGCLPFPHGPPSVTRQGIGK